MQNQDELSLYDDQLLAVTTLTSDGKIAEDFGTKGIHYKTYETPSSDFDGSLLTG